MSALQILAVTAAAAVPLAYVGLHCVARHVVSNTVLRDNGRPKARHPVVPYPAIDADFYRQKAIVEAADGSTYELECLLVLNRHHTENKSVLVFCQGRMTTIEEGYRFLPFFMAAGHHVLIFNYRGVGAPGWATFDSVCQDGVSAHILGQKVVSYLLQGHWGFPPPDQQIDHQALVRTGLLGYSLGGWIATFAAAKTFGEHKEVNGVLALMDTGADMYEAIVRRASYVRLLIPSLLLHPRLDNLALVRSPYPETKLIAHGERDDVQYPTVDDHGRPTMGFGFPMGDGKRLFAAAPGIFSRFFQLKNSSHKDMNEKDPATLSAFFRAIYAALNRQPGSN